jgi:hypothetical protein
VLPLMRGFSIQDGGPWPQAEIDAMHTEGATFERLVVFWNKLQDTNCGALSSGGPAYLSDLSAQVKEAQNDVIYTEVELHLNTGATPACAGTTGSDFDKYMAHGQWITSYLANYFGNPSRASYIKSIVGFGLNEPPPPDGWSDTTVNTVMEQDQSTMLTWIRGTNGTGGPAPQWIGFVAYPYASSTPIFNADPNAQYQCTNCADANPNAYASVGGNVVLDLHDYLVGCTSEWNTVTGLPMSACDGRQHNGEPYTVANGGWAVHTSTDQYPAYPCCGATRTLAQEQFTNYLRPYLKFSQQAQWPLMIGESGVQGAVNTGTVNYATDKAAIWHTARPALELEWDFNTNQANDPFAADPGAGTNGWLKYTNTLFAAP